MCVCVRVCACLCVYKHTRSQTHTHTHIQEEEEDDGDSTLRAVPVEAARVGSSSTRKFRKQEEADAAGEKFRIFGPALVGLQIP